MPHITGFLESRSRALYIAPEQLAPASALPLTAAKVFQTAHDGGTRLRILFLIRSLEFGGAERQLTNLAAGLVEAGHTVCVASYYAGGPYLSELSAAGVRAVSLDKRGRWDLLRFTWRLIRLLRRERPQVLHGFMPSENLISLLAGRIAIPATTIVWGIRASKVDTRIYGILPGIVYSLQRWLVRCPDLIISNSHAGLESLGPTRRLRHAIVIPNGIDTERFRPFGDLRNAGRRMLDASADERIVAMIGRLDPMKGHDIFLRAVALAKTSVGKVRFAIVGSGSPQYRASLLELAAALSIADSIIWHEAVAEIEVIYNTIDVLVIGSLFGEGFPNVAAEAMACGIQVVATDVGDTARVVGPHGRLVPANDPQALAAGIVQALNDNAGRGELRRDWIVQRFGVGQMVRSTEAALLDSTSSAPR